MLSRSFCAGVALLVAVSVTLSADAPAKKGGPRNFAIGKVVALEVKDGAGTLTVLARKGKGEEPKEVKFAITKDTKFVKDASKEKEGVAVESAQVAETFHKDAGVAVRFEGEGNNLTATRVSTFTPRKRPNNK